MLGLKVYIWTNKRWPLLVLEIYKASERDKTRKWKIEQRAKVKNSSLVRKLRGQSPQNAKFKKAEKD